MCVMHAYIDHSSTLDLQNFYNRQAISLAGLTPSHDIWMPPKFNVISMITHIISWTFHISLFY